MQHMMSMNMDEAEETASFISTEATHSLWSELEQENEDDNASFRPSMLGYLQSPSFDPLFFPSTTSHHSDPLPHIPRGFPSTVAPLASSIAHHKCEESQPQSLPSLSLPPPITETTSTVFDYAKLAAQTYIPQRTPQIPPHLTDYNSAVAVPLGSERNSSQCTTIPAAHVLPTTVPSTIKLPLSSSTSTLVSEPSSSKYVPKRKRGYSKSVVSALISVSSSNSLNTLGTTQSLPVDLFPKKKKRKSEKLLESEDEGTDDDCESTNSSFRNGSTKKDRNKVSASAYRKRRKVYLDNLEHQVEVLTQTKDANNAQITQLKEENTHLKDKLNQLQNYVDELLKKVDSLSAAASLLGSNVLC